MNKRTQEFVESVVANLVGNSITDVDKLDLLRAILIAVVELHEKVDKLTEQLKEKQNGNQNQGSYEE